MARIDPAAYVIGAEAVWLADQRDRAAAIACRRWSLCGTEDEPTPPELSMQLAELIPGARYEAIERAGHLTNLEQPDAFNRLVGAFLDGVERGLRPLTCRASAAAISAALACLSTPQLRTRSSMR